jgi:hypothetical protein
VENIARSVNHPELYFTDQDELLVAMMANVIATVIYSVRQGEGRIGDILKRLGILSHPVNAARDLLREFAQSDDSGIIDQLAMEIVSILDGQPEATPEEIKALFEAGANQELYGRIASRSRREDLRWLFNLFSGILTLAPRPENWDQVEQVAGPWLQLHDNTGDADHFASAAHDLVGQVAAAIHAGDAGVSDSYASPIWAGAVLDVGQDLGDNIDRIPLVFQRTGEIDDPSIERLYSFAQNGMDRPYQVLMLVAWRGQPSAEHLEHLRRWMGARAIDIILADPIQLMQIMQAANPEEELRSLVLRQATRLSPFVTVGPVPPSMFFGRDRELRTLVDYLGAGRSCAVIAGRRYGKTSVSALFISTGKLSTLTTTSWPPARSIGSRSHHRAPPPRSASFSETRPWTSAWFS